MLILSRKIGESIIIKVGSDNIKITILESNNGTLKLGFEAPNDIKIYRSELYEEIVNQNIASVIDDVSEAANLLKKEIPNNLSPKYKNINFK
ncbi:MAG: carbon storage regulator CsrA [Defluviitoga tunisiensis]|uniref:Translational regulator CsrA n=1 Tax=Defluviitoga tunisiensis TaxID=1006576 RepID=A0A0C7NKI2_DEFTU|nr:carbon storage regulator CsrA [Defluviitoga tunisiensis]MDD3600888.1 carbon storage regulator CsrA [Defluviitoga tunisiensis]MDY0379692.1 carbon storage regulator CsrA [Defluviitoga tunisiensis]CEP78401.1 carbon storage regulator [Defluviitoga tunisiensis]HHV02141.1 carbon storage regulator CsrA [Defluviitoga tunisiensis]HOB55686.1 carbon storage regulator CsrA [Defluviitoga tunisiensis]